MHTVTCPHCGTVQQVCAGTGTTCKNRDCKATLHIGSDGTIKSSKPGKK